ncbi:NAD(P)/FAD-dependent oxidoreductase [Paracoccus tibetensis]|uniref:Glycine/D-amino acid oxidase n=1 Tax=Paracoccus tibetensis TaxID=336292 RepID=A0A1G5K1F5_9RHOB|nr:FAD-dependent oxidoreductase [Paracoccus tibetensis]SCY94485.1 Glycine/D-amino acid oxidase [Paracoccus tibetensis]
MTEPSRIAKKSTPYWWEAAPVRPLPEQALQKQVDVVVLGAGYAGLSAGLTLARAGRSVAIFDAMNPGEGASSRNGGITSGSIRPGFATLTRKFGERTALAIEAEGKRAREFLYGFLKDEGIDCDFRLTGAFRGALGHDQYDVMARAADTLAKRLGIDTYAVPHAEQRGYIGTDFYRGGVARMDIGGLHPAKFHAGLLRVTLAAGVTVHSHTPVTAIAREGAGFEVTTSAGKIAARQVLVCTNGYTDGAVPFLRRRLVPVRSRIIVTDPLPAELMDRLMPRRMMMSENRKLGFYYRPTPDGASILLGGRDSSFAGDPVEPILRLRDGLTELFPELCDVGFTHSWFGNVAMNRDMLPRMFEKHGVLYASGFCGSGVVWAPWLGRRAAQRLLGERVDEPSAFDMRPPAAVPFFNGKPWFIPAIIKGYAIQDRIALSRAKR